MQIALQNMENSGVKMLLVKLMRMNIFIRFNRTLAIFRVECERIGLI